VVIGAVGVDSLKEKIALPAAASDVLRLSLSIEHVALATEGPAVEPAFYVDHASKPRVHQHSQKQTDGTAIMREHRTSAFVVGAGMQTREETIP